MGLGHHTKMKTPGSCFEREGLVKTQNRQDTHCAGKVGTVVLLGRVEGIADIEPLQHVLPEWKQETLANP